MSRTIALADGADLDGFRQAVRGARRRRRSRRRGRLDRPAATPDLFAADVRCDDGARRVARCPAPSAT